MWWIFDNPELNKSCRDIIGDPGNTIIVSSVSTLEIATKYHIGKLPEAKQIVEQYSGILRQAQFIELAIATNHALRAGSLQVAHRDPFDLMIMAQAEIENLPVISYDAAFCTGLIQVIPS